jgi:hypothetical protein
LNKIDSEIDTTYEGDNTVLLQQVSKALVREFSFKGSGSEFSVDSAPLFDSHDLMFLESKEFLLSALKWRVTHLLTRLYLKLNSATTKALALCECCVVLSFSFHCSFDRQECGKITWILSWQ